ncbi:MAG: sensor histidine kinase [Cyanobacteria bacterium J06598_1]
MDIGQLIARDKETIIQIWVKQVRTDSTIERDRNLTYTAVLDSLPMLMDGIAHLLSRPVSEDVRTILRSGVSHGELRAQQGYDAKEIVREYAILRDVIFDTVEPQLLQSEPTMLLRVVRLINGAVDQVVSSCLKRYTEERLKEVNLLYDEMVASNQELDRLVRNEQTNLAHLAHELKSPLSCIIGYSDLYLRQQATGNSDPKLSFIERVLSSGRQLLAMINETLEISSYKAGQVAVNLDEVDVCAVVEEVATVMDTLAQQKNLAVILSCPAATQKVWTDRNRLRQVVTNLLSNAVRYTETGNVRVSVKAQDERIEIAIADTGFGIADEEQKRIFEPFYQGEAGQQQPSSTGLGLAIAYQMVKLLQGTIHLTSTPAVGSTFTISLPLRYQTEKSQTEEGQTEENVSPAQPKQLQLVESVSQ